MTTLGTMKTRIASDILRPAWADNFIFDAIQDAISDYEGQRFAFNVNRFRLNTVIGQETYTVPDDIKTEANVALATGETLLEIDGVSVRYNNSAYPLCAVTEPWIENYTTTSTQGQPTHYCWIGTRFRLAAIPDQVYPIYILGHKKLSTLSDNGDTNAWMTDAAKLIRNRAKAILYRDVLRDPPNALAAEKSEMDALAALKRQLGGQQTNTLQAWGY